ncbi:hypothetical protein Poly30_43960 [Planctomycetes bacterium Poly30]|uniref:Uncharacterized protein n=1 Tax=Saltatorellus ferox TaxID=2528018 RepID=A0A518EXP3_9BACT|nr:hypothetical protein Poly30_43960 [Planctomycetes bacterium Poly30]
MGRERVEPGGPSPAAADEVRRESRARPVSPLWVLGTLLVLLLLVGGVMFVLKPRGQVLDAAEAETLMFASVPASLPYGLERADARRLPSGEVVLKYAGEGKAGEGPESLTMIQFPAARAESVLDEQFQKLRFDSGSGMGGGMGGGGGGSRGGSGGGPGGPPGGGGRGGGMGGGGKKPKLQDAGFMDWRGYSANYARLRHAAASVPLPETQGESGPQTPSGTDRADKTMYETVRVNLSTGGRCIIAYVRFPLGVEGTVAAVGELLGSFEPLVAASASPGASER